MDSNIPVPTAFDTTVVFSSQVLNEEIKPQIADFNTEDAVFELGVWLRGLSAFGRICGDLFAADEPNAGKVAERGRDFRLIHSGLLRAANLNNRLRKAADSSGLVGSAGLKFTDLDALGGFFQQAIPFAKSLADNGAASFGEWAAWNSFIREAAALQPLSPRLEQFGRVAGRQSLPEKLISLFQSSGFQDRADYEDVIDRVGFSLRAIETVGAMLENDLPLKPSLLIFAVVYEETKLMIEHINNSLSRMPEEDTAMFRSLDTASYTASLELKKVFQQELRGIVRLLPPTSVYARIETAYCLLLDSFQQILVELARSVEPNASPFDFFPRFQLKLDQSLVVREHLWQLLKANQACETDPEPGKISSLREKVKEFIEKSLRLLHYKDGETFERFYEEIEAARDKKDLVSILHRFGAYLETLFGQVSMRAVLANHPFEAK
ncbi:MAG: hypothetical protein C4324_02800 [Blastocatellia bacterium]